MPVYEDQHFREQTNEFFLQLDPLDGVNQPLLHIGSMQPTGPKPTVQKHPIKVPHMGTMRTVKEVQTELAMATQFRFENLNMKNLVVAYYGKSVDVFTQAAAPVTAVAHTAFPGAPVKIKLANGTPVFDVASIQAVREGVTPLVKGTDFDYNDDDLLYGMIRILEGGAIAAETAIEIDFTPKAITGKRQIEPLKRPCTIEGEGYLYTLECGGDNAGVWIGRYSLTVNNAEWLLTETSRVEVTAETLWKRGQTHPFGRFIQYKGGAIPA